MNVLGSDLWCVSGEVFWSCSFVFLSLESDLQTSTRSLNTRASPWWSVASSGPVAPSHGYVGLTCSARDQHALGRSLLEPVREATCLPGHGWWILVVPMVLVVVHCPGWSPVVARVTAFPDVGSILASVFVFYFFCSQFAFVMLKCY